MIDPTAFQVRTQPESPLETFTRLAQLKMMGSQQTAVDQENQLRQQQLNDQKTVMQILSAHNGDMTTAMPELAGKVTPQTYMGLKKYDLEVRSKLAEIDKNKLPVLQDQNDRLNGLIAQAKDLPDMQYTAAWPQLAAAAKAIKPDLQLDPNQPIPKEQLAQIGLQTMTMSKYLDQAKAKAEINKNNAQANAAGYKDSGGVLYDITGKAPTVAQGQPTAPADELSAATLAVPVGTMLPLDTLLKAKRTADAGVRSVQANGRSLLVDGSGRVVKDLGAATPVVMNNIQNAGMQPGDDSFEHLAQGVASGAIKISSAISPRAPATLRSAFLDRVLKINPEFKDYENATAAAVTKSATSGKIGDEITAFNTAIDHAQLLREAAVALKNGDVQLFNKWANRYATETGSSIPTNFQTIADAFRGESTAVYNKGHITEGLLKEQGDKMSGAQSPDQIIQALDTSISLMRSKKIERKAQVDAGLKGKINWDGAHGSDQSTPAAGGFDWNAHPKVK
jgi:hypothetical protein